MFTPWRHDEASNVLGHPTAQYNFGFMYANGRGVPQNYVQAHKWFNLAASRQAPTSHVRDTAIKGREIMASLMTRANIAEA